MVASSISSCCSCERLRTTLEVFSALSSVLLRLARLCRLRLERNEVLGARAAGLAALSSVFSLG